MSSGKRTLAALAAFAAAAFAGTSLDADFGAEARHDSAKAGLPSLTLEFGADETFSGVDFDGQGRRAARAMRLAPGEGKQGDASLDALFFRIATEGRLSENFSFEASVRIRNDRTSFDLDTNHYQAYEGLPYNVQSDRSRTWDSFTGVARWKGSFFRLQAGVDNLSSGPAERNPLLLGGAKVPWRPWMNGSSTVAERAPMLHGAFSMFVGPLTYTQISAQLQHTTGCAKYLHLHKLQALFRRGSLSLGEAVVYGDVPSTEGLENPSDSSKRDMEPGYALPFVPYFFAEHYLGDRDNSMLFVDFTARPLPFRAFDALEIYGELLIDDLKSPDRFFDDWWGNKWAFTGGVRHRLQGRIPWGWGWEFTQIEPWVYTHHKGAGYDMSHYGFPIGSDLGPNSREHWFHVDVEPELLGLFRFGFSMVWKGFDRGSSVADLHHYLIDGEKKTLLDPSARARWSEVSLAWSRVFPLGISAGLEYAWLTGDAEGFRIQAEAKVPFRAF